MGNSSHLQPAAWTPLLFCCGPSVVSDQLRAPAAMMSMLRLLLAALLLLTSLPVSTTEPETCFSRQHQSAIVNMQLALNRQSTAMDARVVRSERDCVLACCSEEVKPGAKCNMVVFHGNKPAGDNNCFLFHCPSEQDCPLMKALDGINTYDIYKERTTPATSLLIVPKDAAQSGHALQNAGAERDKAAQGALKSGVVAVMVLGLAVLTLALAVGGRKAMESFDRRHYTRLELNDLHYEMADMFTRYKNKGKSSLAAHYFPIMNVFVLDVGAAAASLHQQVAAAARPAEDARFGFSQCLIYSVDDDS
ncbi:uncharacterized protein V6R79_019140 [Siganus canaliculatus]